MVLTGGTPAETAWSNYGSCVGARVLGVKRLRSHRIHALVTAEVERNESNLLAKNSGAEESNDPAGTGPNGKVTSIARLHDSLRTIETPGMVVGVGSDGQRFMLGKCECVR